ncbi:hypothetical protein HK098_005558 [Nowakowskiella sp. JEL0407]|nr:hypothetical protein HK098_005558 [Nowakowskiella sp. JEL0407]
MIIHPDILAVIFEQTLLSKDEPAPFLKKILISHALVCKGWAVESLRILWRSVPLLVLPKNTLAFNGMDQMSQTTKLYKIMSTPTETIFNYNSFIRKLSITITFPGKKPVQDAFTWIAGIATAMKHLSKEPTFRHFELTLKSLHETHPTYMNTFMDIIQSISDSTGLETISLSVFDRFQNGVLNKVVDTLLKLDQSFNSTETPTTRPKLQFELFKLNGETAYYPFTSVIHSSEFDVVVRKIIQTGGCRTIEVDGQWVESRVDTWWTPPGVDITPESLLSLPNAKPTGLETIRLNGILVARDALIHVSPSDSIRFFSNLKYLSLKDVIFVDDNFLITLAESLKSIEELSIVFTWNKESDVTGDSVSTISWPRIKKLDLSGVKRLSGSFLDLVLRDCPQLSELQLQRVDLITKELIFEEIIPKAAKLSILNVSYCKNLMDVETNMDSVPVLIAYVQNTE